ncbi:MAG TPA: GLPGLI family protein [Flavobacteriaceae bacterium]|nr:GLPGLI family protein [Flavobacteriaceae bacterium]
MRFLKNTWLLLICVLPVVSLAQEGYITEYEVQYEVTYSIDSLNLNQKTEETVYLFSGKSYGVFLNHNEANKEAIEAALDKMRSSGRMDYVKAGWRETNFRKNIYKDFSENKVAIWMEIMDQPFRVKNPIMPLKWEMQEDSKEFMNYTVHKATTIYAGRDYEAWFTLEIPINDGPYIFYGLPGLIVELYDTENHYHFKLKSIEKLEETKTWIIPEGKAIDRAEEATLLSKELDAIIADVMRMFAGPGEITVQVDGKAVNASEYKRIIIKEVEQKNNRIERE